MNVMTKTSLLLFFLLSTSFQPVECPRQMLIQHVGSSNKAIFPLVFSNQAIRYSAKDFDVQTVVVLSNSEFSVLEKSVLAFNSSVRKQRLRDDYGTFTTTIIDSCKQERSFAYDVKKSKAFFVFLLQQSNKLNRKAKEESQYYLNGVISVL